MTNAADIAIRLRRAAFNRALSDRDLGAIGPILAPAAVLIAGTDSALISGRKAQLAAWKHEFAAPEQTVYVRQPTEIVTSPIFPLALEHGEWRGVLASDGTTVASGTYTAKWRQSGEEQRYI